MPVTKSAKKKLRQDKKREAQNALLEKRFRKILRTALKTGAKKDIAQAMQLADKTAKKHIYHANKVARIKSNLAKRLVTQQKRVSEKPAKRQAQKTKSSKSK